MPTVIITRVLPGRITSILHGCELVAPLDGEDRIAVDRFTNALPGADAILAIPADRVDESVLAAAPRLRIVANCGVGYDNIATHAATQQGVLVTNTPDVVTDAVADLTMALMLAVARRIPEGIDVVRRGTWTGEPGQLPGLDLSGATLGIVGLGRIGAAVWRRARAFGMRLVYTSTRPSESEGERLGTVRNFV